VNSTNLYPISHRFRVIEVYWFKLLMGVVSLVRGKPLHSRLQDLASEN